MVNQQCFMEILEKKGKAVNTVVKHTTDEDQTLKNNPDMIFTRFEHV